MRFGDAERFFDDLGQIDVLGYDLTPTDHAQLLHRVAHARDRGADVRGKLRELRNRFANRRVGAAVQQVELFDQAH